MSAGYARGNLDRHLRRELKRMIRLLAQTSEQLAPFEVNRVRCAELAVLGSPSRFSSEGVAARTFLRYDPTDAGFLALRKGA
jgi:hypothetical protein